MYKAADQRTNLKKQVIGGQEQFGATHGALTQEPKIQEAEANGPTRSATDLGGYFDALAAATTTEKIVLE